MVNSDVISIFLQLPARAGFEHLQLASVLQLFYAEGKVNVDIFYKAEVCNFCLLVAHADLEVFTAELYKLRLELIAELANKYVVISIIVICFICIIVISANLSLINFQISVRLC